jgi:type III secretion system needle length determinant
MNIPSTDEVSNRNRNGFSMNTIEDSGFSSSREAAAVQARPGTNEAARHEFDPLYPEPSQAAAPKTRGKADLPESEAPEKRNGAAPPPDSVEETSLSSLMSRLFSEHLGTTPVMTSPVAQTAPAEAPRTAEMVDHLVDQILVSHPDTVGEREVRLRVNSSVLPDTEIRLSRGADGLLSVTLTTGRADSFQTLVAAQADLKQALDSRENREVRLVVSDAREAGAEDGNSDRRSRGYTDYAPDDGGMR